MFQAKMITGKITKNSIKNLGFKEKKLQQVETSDHNKNLNLQISGFREKKVTASGNISS